MTRTMLVVLLIAAVVIAGNLAINRAKDEYIDHFDRTRMTKRKTPKSVVASLIALFKDSYHILKNDK